MKAKLSGLVNAVTFALLLSGVAHAQQSGTNGKEPYSFSMRATKGFLRTEVIVEITTTDAQRYPLPRSLQKYEADPQDGDNHHLGKSSATDVPLSQGKCSFTIPNSGDCRRLNLKVHIRPDNWHDIDFDDDCDVPSAPNLKVDKVTFAENVFEDTPFDIQAVIRETNGDMGATTTVSLYEGNALLGSLQNVSVPKGGRTTVVFPGVVAATPGKHSYIIKISITNPTEYDIANNSYSFSISILAKPDLLVEKATFPSQVFTKTPFDVQATVRESSGKAAATCTVSLFEGVTLLAKIQNVNVHSGSTERVTFRGIQLITAGQHSITVRISDSDPAEADVSNNTYSFPLTALLRPDLRVESATAPAPLFVNTAFDIDAVVREYNGQSGATATISLYEGKDLQVQPRNITVAAGGSTHILFQGIKEKTTGTHTYTIKISDVDPDEVTDANNSYSLSVTILNAPSAPTATAASSVTQTSFSANWNSAAGATGYYLDVARNNGFTSMIAGYNGKDVGNVTTFSVTGLSANTTYYYRVRAYNPGGTSSNSGTITVTTPNVPSPPMLSLPSDAAINQATNVALTWNAISGATAYRLQVSTSNTFAPTVYDNATLTGTSQAMSSLSNNTTYYWHVSATNAGGTSSYSTIRSFTTLPNVPSAPMLSSPSDAAINQTTNVTVSWNAVFGATTYRLQVSTRNTFATTVYDNATLTCTLQAMSSLWNNTTYYWQVSATNAGGTSSYSAIRSFTTLPIAPSAPMLSSPANAFTGVSVNTTLGWIASAGAESYTVQLSTLSDFSAGVTTQGGIAGTSQLMSSLSSNTTYYWRVSATNAGGTSSYSAAFSFTTIIAAPSAPTLSLPANGSTGVSVNPTLGWIASVGAASYTVQLSTLSDFSSGVTMQSGIAGTSQPMSSLSNNTTYYWRVSATNAGGTSSYSAAFSFTTIVAAPSAPTLSSPANGSTGVSINPTLGWIVSAGAASYTVQLSTFSDFSSGVTTQIGIAGTSQAMSSLSSITTYYWRVSATNAGGTSSYSAAFSFTTIIVAPSAPTTTTASAVAQTSFSANWSSVSGATGYYLDVATDDGFANFVSGYSNKFVDNVTTYPVTGLLANTTYYYRVRAYNAGGTSPNSGTSTLLTLPGSSSGDDLIPLQSSLVYAYDRQTKSTRDVSSGGSSLDSTFEETGSMTYTATASGIALPVAAINAVSWTITTPAGTFEQFSSANPLPSGVSGSADFYSMTDINKPGVDFTMMVDRSLGTIQVAIQQQSSFTEQYKLVLGAVQDAVTGLHANVIQPNNSLSVTFTIQVGENSWGSTTSIPVSPLVMVSSSVVADTTGYDSDSGIYSTHTVIFVHTRSAGPGAPSTTASSGNKQVAANEDQVSPALPLKFGLQQNYPNPFNPSTTIEFSLAKASYVTLKVYDMLAREVATIVAQDYPAGVHRFRWDARLLPSGVYIYRITAGDFVAQRKLLLLK